MDGTNSAVHRVFNTTELIELVLLDDNIRMDQLFVLQRVSKRLQTVIAGSQKLQIKMFGKLVYSSKDANSGREENISRLLKDGSPLHEHQHGAAHLPSLRLRIGAIRGK
jgi:hypothetical protein